jgi:hypothetical protein
VQPSVNPYESPRANSAEARAVSDSEVRLAYGERLPAVCVLCGTPPTTVRSVVFHRRAIGELVYAFWSDSSPAFIGVLFGDRAVIPLPLCHAHRHFRRGWPWHAGLLMWAFVVLVVALLLIAFKDVQPSLHVLMSLAGLALLDLVILTLIIRSTFRIRATRIRDRSVTLTGVAPEFARAYDEYQRTKLDAAVKYVLEGIQ